jgi:hypothetical protein
MPITPDAPFPKTQGDNLRSKDWNDAITEVIRLDNAKADRAGDTFSGPLSVAALGVGSAADASGIKLKSLTRIDEGATGSGAWANLGSNLFFDGAWKQVDATKAGASLHINGDGAGQEFRFFRSEANGQNQRNVAIIGSATSFFTGNVGIGNASPQYALDVRATGAIKLGLEGNGGGQLVLANNPNDNRIWLEAYNSAGNGHATEMLLTGHFGQNVPQLTFAADHTQANGDLRLANSDVYFTNPNHNHTGFGNTPGFAAIENTANFGALMILGRAGETQGRTVKLWDYFEVHGLGGAVLKFGQSVGIKYSAGDGIRGEPNLWLDAAGTVILKSGFQTNAMDVAERFQTSEPVEPGDVLVFDPEQGAARLCDQQGDSRVVGIVSGQPGFILGLEETEIPVALCGRVPCKVDAEFGPVRAGDLLMTSPTKGHAQRVLDATKTAGKILGKALAPLLEGKGEIPVLVFLH